MNEKHRCKVEKNRIDLHSILWQSRQRCQSQPQIVPNNLITLSYIKSLRLAGRKWTIKTLHYYANIIFFNIPTIKI